MTFIDLRTFGTIGSGTGWSGEVNTFADLPPAADNTGEVYLVKTRTGSLFTFNLKEDGFYRSTGSNWVKVNEVQFILSDDATVFTDDGDTTKRLAFELNGIPTNTLITATWQSTSGTVAYTSDIPVQATETTAGIAEIATQTESNDGTDDTRFITPLKLANWSGTTGIGSILSKTIAIDGTVVGNTSLFTVPAGKEAVVRNLTIRINTISGGGAVPKISLGTNAATYDNIITSQSLSGLNAANEGFTFIISGVFHVGQDAEVITLRVNNASSYTTYSIDVDLIGYTI